MGKMTREFQDVTSKAEKAADGGGREGASNIPAKANVPQKGPWTKTKPVFTKAKRQTGRDE